MLPKPVYRLRPATQEDDATIRRLIRRANINPIGVDWQRFVVAVSPAGELLAAGQIKPHRDGSRELASIVVAPGWRGHGLARAIIERLLASQDGPMYLMCRSSLGPLYEKFGFRAIQQEEMPKYFRRISQLAGLAEALRQDSESLLVMLRE